MLTSDCSPHYTHPVEEEFHLEIRIKFFVVLVFTCPVHERLLEAQVVVVNVTCVEPEVEHLHRGSPAPFEEKRSSHEMGSKKAFRKGIRVAGGGLCDTKMGKKSIGR